ncbi:hypothetical protein GCM10022226_17940 [Sphaerisporangium flaviroseum]|uniref:Uncharacterized protein n=1 Tax=Sphaerisporangium flaviroseum TaxID=509199 RepID=A0ABP7HLU2_9ACTN
MSHSLGGLPGRLFSTQITEVGGQGAAATRSVGDFGVIAQAAPDMTGMARTTAWKATRAPRSLHRFGLKVL